MEQFDLKGKNSHTLKSLETMISRGMELGLDLKALLAKIESIKQMIDDGIVRIVLLGGISDGKTSTIAGLLGRLEDTMKIDEDESSDELEVYRPNGLKKGFEIVDTPGLFGTKEKELDGRNVKFSDITKKYLSEAHIIIYVCDAVTPLKDSHVPVIKWIMRDLNKLDSTIFVINKMDEAGYDLTDTEEYESGTSIKKENLKLRLRDTINLTPDEENKLHIVCIAADPKGKGLAHWFAVADEYMRRSRINLLREELNGIVDRSDATKLTDSAVAASVKDVLVNVADDIDKMLQPTSKTLEQCKDSNNDLTQELTLLKSELDTNRGDVLQQMNDYKASLLADIDSATVETIGDVINRNIGVQGDKISFYVFKSNVSQMMQGSMNAAQTALQSSNIKFEEGMAAQDTFMKKAAQNGAKYLKGVEVSSDHVLAVRDMFFSTFKFKPWGAVKLANTITKGFTYAAAGIGVAIDAYSYYKEWKANRQLGKIKEDLKKVLNDAFANIFALFNEESAFIKNFAPQYLQLKEQLEERTKELEVMQQKMADLEAYKLRVKAAMSGEYVEFDEV